MTYILELLCTIEHYVGGRPANGHIYKQLVRVLHAGLYLNVVEELLPLRGRASLAFEC